MKRDKPSVPVKTIEVSLVCSSAADYLTFVATASGGR